MGRQWIKPIGPPGAFTLWENATAKLELGTCCITENKGIPEVWQKHSVGNKATALERLGGAILLFHWVRPVVNTAPQQPTIHESCSEISSRRGTMEPPSFQQTGVSTYSPSYTLVSQYSDEEGAFLTDLLSDWSKRLRSCNWLTVKSYNIMGAHIIVQLWPFQIPSLFRICFLFWISNT